MRRPGSFALLIALAGCNAARGGPDTGGADSGAYEGSFGADFVAGASVEVGPGARDIAVLDCDGDEHLDLLVGNEGAGSLSVAAGYGDGTFAPQRTYFAGSRPYELAPGDFDGDGKADLAVANFISGASVVFGDGDCGFSDPVTVFGDGPFGEHAGGALAIGVGDFDGDGFDDVVAQVSSGESQRDHQLAIFFSDHERGFEEGPRVTVSAKVGNIEVVDLDGDGELDIVGTSSWLSLDNDGWVHLVRGLGQRRFAEEQAFETVPNPGTATLADFDDDGVLDLATSSRAFGNASALAIYRGLAGARFDSGTIRDLGGAQASTTSAGDLDLDGNIDIVVALDFPGAVAVFPGNGDGSFAEPVLWEIEDDRGGESDSPDYVELADLDEDGMLDIAATNGNGTVSIFLSSSPEGS